jgi:syntaxin 18
LPQCQNDDGVKNDDSVQNADSVKCTQTQARGLDTLHATATATAMTVARGNAELRKGVGHGAGFRHFLLVFVVGASLSLLFLHWYS